MNAPRPTPGRRRAAAALGLPLLMALLGACSPAAAPPPAAKAPPALQLAPGDWLQATVQPLVEEVEFGGPVEAVHRGVVKARLAAELLRLDVREGERVRAGQVIGRLDDADARLRLRQAEEQAANAQAQLDIAARGLANNQALVEQGFISRNALDTSQSNREAAQATLQAARAAAELARRQVADAVLRAPLDGEVAQRLAEPGERLALDARVVEIVDRRQLELAAALPPQAVPGLQAGAPAEVQLEGLERPLAARLLRLSPDADPATRAVTAYLGLPADPALRPGLYARGRLQLARHEVLALPLDAVRQDRSPPYVLVVEAEGRVVARSLSLGRQGRLEAQDGARGVEVLEGLRAGETLLAGRVGAPAPGQRVEGAGAPATPAASAAQAAR